ncbi:phage tail protein [Pseudomonas sp. TH49]|uniref:phage tail assembly chaperone n=1 Tax=Pseudomonas sp. TH49 TaxID=2796413 RepID=UPI001912C7EA|nr:phage tail assembly chaperone [Pseudomonas sp. TH49]MBK5343117.1 phage tail protein [Pseudomonas sp. TH49]
MGVLIVIFFSAAELGFYESGINDVIPGDAVEVSDVHRRAILDGQTAGMVVAADEFGGPILVERPAPSSEVLAAAERVWRDRQLAATDPLVSRHRDEVEEGGSTSITPEQYTELQGYRRLLRDWPQGEQFPLIDHRPIAPPWLIEPIQ